MHVCFCCGWFSFSVLSQEIGWEERLRNDLFCVRWDEKPINSINQSTAGAAWVWLTLAVESDVAGQLLKSIPKSFKRVDDATESHVVHLHTELRSVCQCFFGITWALGCRPPQIWYNNICYNNLWLTILFQFAECLPFWERPHLIFAVMYKIREIWGFNSSFC